MIRKVVEYAFLFVLLAGAVGVSLAMIAGGGYLVVLPLISSVAQVTTLDIVLSITYGVLFMTGGVFQLVKLAGFFRDEIRGFFRGVGDVFRSIYSGVADLANYIGRGLKSFFTRRPAQAPVEMPRPRVEFGFHDGGRLEMEFDRLDDLHLGIEGGARLYAELLMLDAILAHRAMMPGGFAHDMDAHPMHDPFNPMAGHRHNFYAPVDMQARAPRPAGEIEDKTMKAIASDIEDARAKGESQVDLTERLQGPISYERMVDPVLAEDGFTYERGQIEGWLARSNKSPMTREVMGRSLHANAEMKALLNRFEGQEEAKLEVAQAGTVLGR